MQLIRNLDEKEIFKLVEPLYLSSSRDFAIWGWKAHVQVVADFAAKLANKYSAHKPTCISAALLHDVGDVKFDRGEKNDIYSKKTAIEFMSKSGATRDEAVKIFNEVIEPHSCYPGNKPDNIEGKVLATADALAHLTGDFYLRMLWMNFPDGLTYHKWIEWLLKKIERDFNSKIFWVNEKEEVKARYEALKLLFSKIL